MTEKELEIRRALEKLSYTKPDEVANPWDGHITRVNLGPKVVFFHTLDDMVFMFEMTDGIVKPISKARRPI